MSDVKPPVWIAPILGGITLCAMSSASTYYVEKEVPKTKALARDFLLGAILVLCIMQILPESVANGVAMLLSFTSVFSMKNMVGGSSNSINAVVQAPIVTPPQVYVPDFTGGSDDTEVRVGVPRF
jgi:hypothetical protein